MSTNRLKENKKGVEIYSKDARFEIFTPNEISSMMTSSEDPQLQKNIQFTTTLINQVMHNKTIGWFKKLETCVAEHEKKLEFSTEAQEILAGAKTYLNAANRLQAPKEGRRLFYVAAAGNEKMHLVDVYQGFWDDCLGAIPCFVAASIAERYYKPKSNDGKEKAYLYSLLRIKYHSLEKYGEEERNRIKIKVDAAIRTIYTNIKLPTTFILNEEEEHIAETLRENLKTKHKNVVDLKQLFESAPDSVRKYIHIRPAILIQLAQVLDYLYKLIEENVRSPGLISAILPRTMGTTKPAALTIIDAKRKEIAETMCFQEKLLSQYGRDDFIESLHEIIGSYFTSVFEKISLQPVSSKGFDEKAQQMIQKKLSDAYLSVLPPQLFFDFERQQKIQVFEYECEDPPPQVTYSKMSEWRKNYIKMHLKIETDQKPSAPASDQETSCADQVKESKNSGLDLMATRVAKGIHNLKPFSVKVPDFIMDYMYELQDQFIDNAVYQFFVDQADKRNKFFYSFHHYVFQCETEVDFLFRQAQNKVSHTVLFDDAHIPKTRHSLFSSDLKDAVKKRFSAFIAGVAVFSDAFNELKVASVAMEKSSLSEKYYFLKYITWIEKNYMDFEKKYLEIINYWLNYVETFKGNRFDKSIKLLKDLIISVQEMHDRETHKLMGRVGTELGMTG